MNPKMIATLCFDLADKFGSNGREIFIAWLDQKHGFPTPEDWEALGEMIELLPSPGWPEGKGQ